MHLVWLENLITDKHVEGAGFPCSGPGFDSPHLHEKLFKVCKSVICGLFRLGASSKLSKNRKVLVSISVSNFEVNMLLAKAIVIN